MNELEIQLAYFEYLQPPVYENQPEEMPAAQKQHKVSPKLIKRAYKVIACIGAAMLILYTTPKIVQAFMPATSNWLVKAEDEEFGKTVSTKNLNYQPAFDSKLPLGSYLEIPKTKVKTSILEASYEDHENALKKGVWRVGDFGTPDKREKPTILVAHRFGYVAWSNQYRRENSFFNLPKLANGDLVNITHNQRKYVYEVYAQSEGTEIADYSADLVLYTCVDLNSDLKIFRYARLLEI
jgi:sortase (surface protein transpeptidase)